MDLVNTFESILLAGFLALLPALFLTLALIAPFWIWQMFFGRDANGELPGWLDKVSPPHHGWNVAHRFCRRDVGGAIRSL